MPAWRPGESGNPKGRVKGSRNRLSERVLRDIQQHWARHGKQAIQTVFKDDPGLYLRTVASLLPHEVRLQAAVVAGDVSSWTAVMMAAQDSIPDRRDPLLPPPRLIEGEIADPEAPDRHAER